MNDLRKIRKGDHRKVNQALVLTAFYPECLKREYDDILPDNPGVSKL
ncbi:hypothetical protein CSB69_1981 [Morganella morganii]|nr:hypothetical protein CSB69_1981 [Morganella morganii]EMP51592.1 hypothetical protein C790_00987 [Morganella morganii SC01]